MLDMFYHPRLPSQILLFLGVRLFRCHRFQLALVSLEVVLKSIQGTFNPEEEGLGTLGVTDEVQTTHALHL